MDSPHGENPMPIIACLCLHDRCKGSLDGRYLLHD